MQTVQPSTIRSSIRLGTRGSPLALWQAHHVAGLLKASTPELVVELVEIQTSGDRIRDQPLSQLGGQGVFTKEIQRALLDGEVDLAVHSLKDLPTVPVAGLTLGAVPERGPVGDVFISTRHRSFDMLPDGATVATGSTRRRAQLLHRRPDLQMVEIRGNVETRLRKLEKDGLDAIILAEAGLVRLGLSNHIVEILDASWMVPAVGQGALGIECRSDDPEVVALLSRLNHQPTRSAVLAERAFLRCLGSGCQVPIGAFGVVDSGNLTLRGVVSSLDGVKRWEGAVSGENERAEELGIQLANELQRRGAVVE